MGGALRRIHHLFIEGTAAGLADGQLLERFLSRGDEAAFAALVERHGPMVLRACRSVLARPEDVEDAFQATFLVLVCKARSIRGQQALAAWLGRVAHRVAGRAGVESARRRSHERRAGAARAAVLSRAEPDDDWRLALHEELGRLSDRYRLPLLLCDLEGKTHAQAAAELGCGPATVQRRLTAARDLLRSRLTRRGIALSTGTLAAVLGRPAAAAVPTEWVETAVAGARSLSTRAARLAIGQVAATAAESLARQSLHSTASGRLAAIAAVSVALIGLVGIARSAGTARPDEPPAVRPQMPAGPSMPSPPGKPAAGGDVGAPETVTFYGRVVDPRGRPVAGAALHLAGKGLAPSAFRTVRATSGPDGRFRFEVRGEEFHIWRGQDPRMVASLVARAAGYACGIEDGGDAAGESTVTMARDDAVIAGRVVDLEGRPVAGASVRVMEVRLALAGMMDGDEARVKVLRLLNAARPVQGPFGRSFQATIAEQLDASLKEMEDRKQWESRAFPLVLNRVESEPAAAFIPDVTTGPDGRFRLAGIGRGRIATLQLDGPTIETTKFDVRTWPGAPIRLPASTTRSFDAPWTVYGATFEHVAGPTRPIEGVVRDRQTGRPLADILVYARHPRRWWDRLPARAITGADGRYRLVGLPLGREGPLAAVPACDISAYDGHRIEPRLPPDRCPPYFEAEVSVPKSPGTEPVHLDIALDRGVRVTGRILDKDTGKPVHGRVSYFIFDDNPHWKGGPAPAGRYDLHFNDVDGTFRLVIPPGPGMLAAYAFGPYARAAGVEAIKSRRPDWLKHVPRGMLRFAEEYHALHWIEPAPDASAVTQDLVVEPGPLRPARPGL
jgi:RNA polymerase sigma factor (sigma-70 family)